MALNPYSENPVYFLVACGVILIGLMVTACGKPPTPHLTRTHAASVTPTEVATSTAMPTPTATKTSLPTATPTHPTPQITVISPNGGEEWIEGQTYDIRWRASGVEQVNIAAATGGKDLGHIAFEVDAEAGEYAWTIPQGFVSDFGPSASDAVRIRIYAAGAAEVYDENDAHFTIAAPSGE